MFVDNLKGKEICDASKLKYVYNNILNMLNLLLNLDNYLSKML